MPELPKNYDAKAIEAKWYEWWKEKGYFHAEAGRGGTPYTIVIPPPNVTGILHMGHALNNTIQDVLIRRKRMQGFNTVWVPGTDHAGIATQNVVERQLKKEGKSRWDLGREEFLKRVWAWKEQYGGTILHQLERWAIRATGTATRFTMDEGLSDAGAEVFVRLYDKKLIYRGEYIINWCPRCCTALSDEESEHDGLRRPALPHPLSGQGRAGRLRGGGHHAPRDAAGRHRRGREPARRALCQAEGQDSSAARAGPRDSPDRGRFRRPAVRHRRGQGHARARSQRFRDGQRHDLPMVNVMTDAGDMNENAGPYQGLDRFACRKKIVADLEATGQMVKIDDHAHAVGHCYRCHTVVEPRLSPQWFVKMKPLARPAIAAVKDGRVRFVPERWNKVYLDWMENIRDWCISRQIWWGHRIPSSTARPDCQHEWAAKGQPFQCPRCGSDQIRQDRGRARHLVQLLALAVQRLRLAEGQRGPAHLLSDHDLVTARRSFSSGWRA
jgi:valyl-tRNA synthetase